MVNSNPNLNKRPESLIHHCNILRKDSRYQKESNHQPLICRNFWLLHKVLALKSSANRQGTRL